MNKEALFNLDENTRNAVLKYLTGGLAVGSSAALVTSLMRDIHKKNQRAKLDSTSDDDILYLKSGSDKSAFVDMSKFMWGPGLAMTSAGLGIGGGYMAVSKLYSMLREKKLQKELDEAQRAYVSTLKAEKSAGAHRGYTPGELLSGIPLMTLITAALASGAVTNMALDKAYPSPTKPTRKNPRRIVIERDQVTPEVEKEAQEHLAGVVLESGGIDKSSSLPDLIGAVAEGRIDEVRHNTREFGWDSALDLVKGASRDISKLEKLASARILIEDPYLSTGFNTLVASEFSAMGPSYVKAAQAVEDPSAYVKLAAALQQATREELAQEITQELKAVEESEHESDVDLQTALQRVIPIKSMPSESKNKLEEPSNTSVESTDR